MTYMTVQQAAEAWGLSVRQVQVYCNRGRVPGAQKGAAVERGRKAAGGVAGRRKRSNEVERLYPQISSKSLAFAV